MRLTQRFQVGGALMRGVLRSKTPRPKRRRRFGPRSPIRHPPANTRRPVSPTDRRNNAQARQSPARSPTSCSDLIGASIAQPGVELGGGLLSPGNQAWSLEAGFARLQTPRRKGRARRALSPRPLPNLHPSGIIFRNQGQRHLPTAKPCPKQGGNESGEKQPAF